MTAKKIVNINAAETFEKTLENVITYLTPYSSEFLVLDRVENVIETFEQQVLAQPLSYPRSPELVSIGVNDVRHANIDGFRLLYEVTVLDDEINVYLLLFLDSKQSVEKQLVDYCLYRDL